MRHLVYRISQPHLVRGELRRCLWRLLRHHVPSPRTLRVPPQGRRRLEYVASLEAVTLLDEILVKARPLNQTLIVSYEVRLLEGHRRRLGHAVLRHVLRKIRQTVQVVLLNLKLLRVAVRDLQVLAGSREQVVVLLYKIVRSLRARLAVHLEVFVAPRYRVTLLLVQGCLLEYQVLLLQLVVSLQEHSVQPLGLLQRRLHLRLR